MSHYDIKYKGNLDSQEMIIQGCRDSLQYCGREHYKRVVRVVRQIKKLEQLYFPLAFAGIQGYPVRALHNRYANKTIRQACRKEVK